MTKHVTLKRLVIGVLLFCGVFAYTSIHSAHAFSIYDKKMEDVCDSWSQNMQDYQGQEHCWTCQIFVLLFDAANKAAGQINNALSPPIMKAVVTLCSLWLAIHTLIFFSDVGSAPNLMAFLTKIGGMMIRVGFGYALLAGGAQLAFDYVINPVLTDGAKLATTVLSTTGLSPGCEFTSSGGGSPTSGPMGQEVRESLKCMIEKIASGMARSQSIAQGLRCGAMFYDFGFLNPFPHPGMWIVGATFGCFFWFISFLFPLVMLDVIFRIGLMAGMLPLFVAAWIFPITASYAKKAWDIFLQSCLVFVVTGLIVCILVALVDQSWGAGDQTIINAFQQKMEANQYTDAWDELFSGGVGRGLVNLFLVLCVCFWGVGIASKSDKVANEYVGEGKYPDNCAVKAIEAIISFIFDVIMAVITILTFGATSCLYLFKLGKYMSDSARKLQEIIRHLRRIKEKVQKIQQKMQKLQKVAFHQRDK
ncbi:MAG: hypothetical protein ACI4TE_07355 [Alphaproteobacteria bacterium]